jgi:hypothetical protein
MQLLALQARARHRREPSVRQRIRASIGILAALAVIAAFGVLSGTVPGGQTWRAEVFEIAPPWLVAWLSCALPLAGGLGLIAPSRLPRTRIAVSRVVLLAGAAMSRPGGADARFAEAQTATAYAVLACLLLWAIGATLVLAMGRTHEVLFRLRRSVLWAGPLTLALGFAAALLA